MPSPEITEDVLDLPSPVMPASSKQKDSLIDYGKQNLQNAKKQNKKKFLQFAFLYAACIDS